MKEVLLFGLGENRGGIETYLEKIWRNIDHKRYHFNFIDMTGEGKKPCFYEELTKTGCSFYKITPRNVSISKNRRDIRELFANNHFDIFHFNVNTLSYVYPVQEALRRGCRVVIHSRNAGSAISGKLTRVLHEINKIRVGRMDVTRIAVSAMAGQWLFGSSPFKVYHNGVITNNFVYTQTNRDAIRSEVDCESKQVIGNVGAFLPAKNHTFMVEAFQVYHKRHPDSVLWFIGDGPSRKDIESLVAQKGLSDSVFFFGVRKDMAKLYAGMDLFWFPSLYEGFGNVVLEAECEGVPCLLSDCIPGDAMIMDNTFSFSLKRSLDAWADKMEEAISAQHPNRENCYKEVEAKGASVEAEIKRLEELYESMMKIER